MFRNWAGTRETKSSSQYLKIRAVVWNEVLNWRAANCWKLACRSCDWKNTVSKRSQRGDTKESLSHYQLLCRPRLWTVFFLSLPVHRSFNPEFLFPWVNYYLQLALFGAKEEQKNTIIFQVVVGTWFIFVNSVNISITSLHKMQKHIQNQSVKTTSVSELGEPYINDVSKNSNSGGNNWTHSKLSIWTLGCVTVLFFHPVRNLQFLYLSIIPHRNT